MSLIAKSQKELADTVGIGERTYSSWLREGCPGQAGNYVVRDVVEWAKINKWCQSSDPLLAGGDSDNLERYRGFKADLAELDVQERREELVNIEKVKPVFITCLGFIKAAAEKLDRQFGNDAFNIIIEAWEQAQEHCRSELGEGETKTNENERT
ncbi:hypothetical protein CA11_33300 [Gimesia maris]|uniref:terminase small subunit n=1 Tax=Gimesia maris TaxID=122 RepID=UPI001189D5D4|nr:terminase small subunit [Gimesia maris]QDU15505.1 hypothetical protein CA11_33300 [Gimesia maris]